MTDQAYSAKWNTEPPQLGMQTLWRLAIWGGVATLALFVAVISAFFSSAGSNRQTASAAGQTSTAQVSSAQGTATQGTAAQLAAAEGAEQPRTFAGEPAPRAGDAAEETRRLAEAIRALAADRDQALSRIAALERNLDGVTGTIKRDTGTTKRDSIQRDLAPTLPLLPLPPLRTSAPTPSLSVPTHSSIAAACNLPP